MKNNLLYLIQTQGPMAEEVSWADFAAELRDFAQTHPDAQMPIEMEYETFSCPAVYLRLDLPLRYGPQPQYKHPHF